MNELENISFDKLFKIYRKYFSLKYINTNTDNKLALIALVCFLTNELQKKNKARGVISFISMITGGGL